MASSTTGQGSSSSSGTTNFLFGARPQWGEMPTMPVTPGARSIIDRAVGAPAALPSAGVLGSSTAGSALAPKPGQAVARNANGGGGSKFGKTALLIAGTVILVVLTVVVLALVRSKMKARASSGDGGSGRRAPQRAPEPTYPPPRSSSRATPATSSRAPATTRSRSSGAVTAARAQQPKPAAAGPGPAPARRVPAAAPATSRPSAAPVTVRPVAPPPSADAVPKRLPTATEVVASLSEQRMALQRPQQVDVDLRTAAQTIDYLEDAARDAGVVRGLTATDAVGTDLLAEHDTAYADDDRYAGEAAADEYDDQEQGDEYTDAEYDDLDEYDDGDDEPQYGDADYYYPGTEADADNGARVRPPTDEEQNDNNDDEDNGEALDPPPA